MYEANPGQSILVLVSTSFELPRVRVTGSQLYILLNSTSCHANTPAVWMNGGYTPIRCLLPRKSQTKILNGELLVYKTYVFIITTTCIPVETC